MLGQKPVKALGWNLGLRLYLLLVAIFGWRRSPQLPRRERDLDRLDEVPHAPSTGIRSNPSYGVGTDFGAAFRAVAMSSLPVHASLRNSWTNWTAIAPSPTAVATRLTDPERTSPAANTPGRLVSR